MSGRVVPLFAACLLLSTLVLGCASGKRYAWGSYDSTLYAHYKNPQDTQAYLEQLQEIVQSAEAEDRVPPGLYAEYGYCLYENGKVGEAVVYFEKEKARWPESNVLMEKMIRNARRRQERREGMSSSAPSGAPEELK